MKVGKGGSKCMYVLKKVQSSECCVCPAELAEL